MKCILTLTFSLICFCAFPQAGSVEYSRVVAAPDSASSKVLYSRSKAWLFETYQDAESVIEVYDPDGVLIGGTGAVTLKVQYKRRAIYQDATYKLKIEHKDGRCRISASNVTFLVRNNMAVAAGVGDPVVRVPAENWFIDNLDGKGVAEMKATTEYYFNELFGGFERFHFNRAAGKERGEEW